MDHQSDEDRNAAEHLQALFKQIIEPGNLIELKRFDGVFNQFQSHGTPK